MTLIVVMLHVFVCLFLIAVILLQAGRGQGLSWGVFGGTPQSILGTRTASFLNRLTSGCAIVFLFTCIALNLIETQKSRSLLARPRKTAQLDFSKIKEALKKAEQSEKKEAPASPPESKSPEPTPAESVPPTVPSSTQETRPVAQSAQ